MELVIIIVVGLVMLVAVFAFEQRFDRLEDEMRSREHHPSGSRCPDCHRVISDWEAHRRLFHQPRFAAPEDKW